MNRWKDYSLILSVIIIAILTASLIRSTSTRSTKSAGIRENSSKYSYINPLLATGDIETSKGFDDLKKILTDYVNESVRNKEIQSSAIYFRDLNEGTWTGVNENEKYSPASMYKVAVMIAFLKDAYENHPNLMDQKLRIKINNKEKEFTIGQLIKVMIVDSDNDAKNVLESVLKPELRQRVYSDFGLLAPDVNDAGNTLSPKEYSLFFRILYNANYLGPDLSEVALETLTETTFNEGLVSGVSTSTKVAHKFGYRVLDSSKQELSDCGIVYYPKHPYFVCVMTLGDDVSKLKSFIKDTSGLIYNHINKKY